MNDVRSRANPERRDEEKIKVATGAIGQPRVAREQVVTVVNYSLNFSPQPLLSP